MLNMHTIMNTAHLCVLALIACDPICHETDGDSSTVDLTTSPTSSTSPTDLTCDGADLPGQSFAPCHVDFTCDAPGTICATDTGGAVCVPISSDGCAEEYAACAGAAGFGTGYGAQTDACTLACDADDDCIVAGMVCGPNFGLCLWPTP